MVIAAKAMVATDKTTVAIAVTQIGSSAGCFGWSDVKRISRIPVMYNRSGIEEHRLLSILSEAEEI